MYKRQLKHAPKPHLGYGIISFFCVLAPEGMNEIVFGKEMGKGGSRSWLILILSPRCCHADKMVSPAIIVYNKFTTIL